MEYPNSHSSLYTVMVGDDLIIFVPYCGSTIQMRFTWIIDNVIETRQHQLPASSSTIGISIRYQRPATIHVSSVNDDFSPAGINFALFTNGSAVSVLITYKRLRHQC